MLWLTATLMLFISCVVQANPVDRWFLSRSEYRETVEVHKAEGVETIHPEGRVCVYINHARPGWEISVPVGRFYVCPNTLGVSNG